MNYPNLTHPSRFFKSLDEIIAEGIKYQVLYPDPPWKYGNFDTSDHFKFSGMASEHYDTMTLDDLIALPVKEIVADNAMMFLWTTWPVLCSDNKKFFEMIDAWGFKPKTAAFVWMKTNKNDGKPFFGMGTYTAANSEPCILCTRGKTKDMIKSNRVSQIIQSPLKKHSQKPDIVRKKIVQLVGEVPRLEMFGRSKVPGWDVFGNDEKLNYLPLEAYHEIN